MSGTLKRDVAKAIVTAATRRATNIGDGTGTIQAAIDAGIPRGMTFRIVGGKIDDMRLDALIDHAGKLGVSVGVLSH